MNRLLSILRNKPAVFVWSTVVAFLLIAFLKWKFQPSPYAIWFFVGGAMGIYFMDVAEAFFALSPSPFRSVVFMALFAVVSFFVVTSSGSLLASGLVLSLFLTLLMWQWGEWHLSGNLLSWYRMVAGPVSTQTQRLTLAAFVVIFLAEIYFFVMG